MAIPIREMRNRAHQFIKDFANAEKENAESQVFLERFFNIFDVPRQRVASFEYSVKIADEGGTKRIDLFWPGVLLVEMKSKGHDLDKALDQAFNYLRGLKDSELPQYIMVCDLETFRIKSLVDKERTVYEFKLPELLDHLDIFSFMQGKEVLNLTEYELNIQAAMMLGQLHDALEQNNYTGHQLQVFMVRVLFCMFAEDTGVFNPRQFIKYIMDYTTEHDIQMHLQMLLQTLDTPIERRSPNLPEEQKDFPYVNGHLFSERIDMPFFDTEMREILIECCYFNWKDISPAIFGSLFQSIMDKKQRRNLGTHYTSETNILRAIEPLFLDDLNAELDSILSLKALKTKNERLMRFIEKIRKLKFLDPACGCGNFLIITYRELRELELKALDAQKEDETLSLGLEIQPAIPLNNFYGIEIDEWPARIAEVAMWLTQHQMNVKFAKKFGEEPDLLPLKEHAEIRHANALEIDWAEVVQASELNYIIGNPPFVGKQFRTAEQNKGMDAVFSGVKSYKTLDFVTGWFYKAAFFSQGTTIETGLVATNSITMGEQVGVLWQPLLDMGIHINFAHRTFAWNNDAAGKAAVHCVIIGFANFSKESKYIFDYPDIKGEPTKIKANNINPYLVDAPSAMLLNRSKPISQVSPMVFGSMPNDGGFLLLDPVEKTEILTKYPHLEDWIKPILGAQEFINNGERYCLWLVDASTRELRELMQIPEIAVRLQGVKQMRSASNRASTKKLAETPWQFGEIRHPKEGNYILVPRVSSERRPYVPMGFLGKDTICSDANQMIPNANLYEFGVLTSEMHMDWMRVVAGRLESRYRYSARLVYNNFPWPEADEKQQAQIELLAQKVLDAREEEFTKDAETSLADLYDPLIMPIDLRRAHQNLDVAVDKLYNPKGFKSSLDRVKHLFEKYNDLTKPTKK